MRKVSLPLIAMWMLASIGPAAAQSYVGETTTVAFEYCPSGWVEMDGRLLQSAEYEVLFSLLGTTFGGNDFAAPFGVPIAPAEYLANGTQLRQCISLLGFFPQP